MLHLSNFSREMRRLPDCCLLPQWTLIRYLSVCLASCLPAPPIHVLDFRLEHFQVFFVLDFAPLLFHLSLACVLFLCTLVFIYTNFCSIFFLPASCYFWHVFSCFVILHIFPIFCKLKIFEYFRLFCLVSVSCLVFGYFFFIPNFCKYFIHFPSLSTFPHCFHHFS